MKTALIIHGAYGGPNENWIPWLKGELEKSSYKVIVPTFPTPDNQNLENWMNILTPYLSELNSKSILIGHSIGAVFLLSVLEKLNKPVQSTIFVSGFLHDLGDEDFDKINNTFYDRDFDWGCIKNNSQHISVFHGDNDPYVPTKEADALSGQLGVKAIFIKNGGHLNESAGFTEFPELLRQVQSSSD